MAQTKIWQKTIDDNKDSDHLKMDVLSLLMKEEILSSKSKWQGIPARLKL